MEKICGNCKYYTEKAIPNLNFDPNGNQGFDILGECDHESNWRPSRGNMRCCSEDSCFKFEILD